MEILGKLFGSDARVKILRLFLFNPEGTFDNADVARRAKVYPSTARREIALLSRIGLLKKKNFYRDLVPMSGGRFGAHRKRVAGWALNEGFPYRATLQNFLFNIAPLREGDIQKRLEKVGRLKLIIVSGIFIQDFESRVDLLIVGDNIKRRALENSIKKIEAELGKELRYAVFSTADFEYRLNVYDKLVRDVLDFPHQQIVNRLSHSLR